MLEFLTVLLLMLVGYIGYTVLDNTDKCQFCHRYPAVSVRDYNSSRVYKICIPCIREKLQ